MEWGGERIYGFDGWVRGRGLAEGGGGEVKRVCCKICMRLLFLGGGGGGGKKDTINFKEAFSYRALFIAQMHLTSLLQ